MINIPVKLRQHLDEKFGELVFDQYGVIENETQSLRYSTPTNKEISNGAVWVNPNTFKEEEISDDTHELLEIHLIRFNDSGQGVSVRYYSNFEVVVDKKNRVDSKYGEG